MTKYLGSRKKPETDLLQDTQEENACQEQTHRMVGGSALTMATETLIASKQADAHLFLQWRGLWPWLLHSWAQIGCFSTWTLIHWTCIMKMQ